MDRKETNHKYYIEHREYFRQKRLEWGLSHPNYYQENNSIYKLNSKRRNQRADVQAEILQKYTERKIIVLTYYGNGKCACVLCGFEDVRALSIDHINGGGTEHRRQIHKNMYRWLVDNNYPKGYQTLCMNCQFIKGIKVESLKVG